MTTTLTEPRRVLVGYMHPSDFADVRDGGWINTSLSREPVPFSVPVYADEPIAILRAQADALASPPPAEPGELPPLPYPAIDSLPLFTHPAYSADQMGAYARLALAQSPLPEERVEQVMAALMSAIYLDPFKWPQVRAILEGRQS